MECMEYMDQVVGNILVILLKGFQKRNMKTNVTFEKMDVALAFFCCKRVHHGKVGNEGMKKCLWEKMAISCRV